MKRICAVTITGLLLLFISSIAYSQSYIRLSETTIIEPYRLQVAVYKTTNLIFPYAIKSVDRGSRDVLVQKVKGAENILLVKAGRENITETNLSVITADGKLYSFLINYSPNPPLLNISFTEDTITREEAALLLPRNNEARMQVFAERVAREKRMLHGVKDSKYKMQLRLSGLYIRDDKILCQLEVENRSNISYDIEMLRFFIRDEKRAKRTASQEIELQPLYVYGDTAVIKSQLKNTVVFVLPKFTIPDQKYLSIQLAEKNGGRHLHLNVHNRTIVKAKAIEE